MTVLVADDQPSIVELLKLVLEDAGYAVLHAYDGAAARAILERERPDLVIADINMPHLSGIELAAWVRAREGAAAALPIVLISAITRLPGEVTPPATAFLAKPFDLEAVVLVVEALLPPPQDP
jgi:two-component system OmpR family response regulator